MNATQFCFIIGCLSLGMGFVWFALFGGFFGWILWLIGGFYALASLFFINSDRITALEKKLKRRRLK